MTIFISMLRGVNVGGRRPLKMTELVDLYRSLGFIEPRSYIQSGNVVFGSTAKDAAALSKRIEAAIEKKFGIQSEVILRTAEDLMDVLARNPFAGRTDVAPNKVQVFFLGSEPGAECASRVAALPSACEELHLLGRELFIHFPNGFGKSKLTQNAIDRALGVPATARNWNTVEKLCSMSVSAPKPRN